MVSLGPPPGATSHDSDQNPKESRSPIGAAADTASTNRTAVPLRCVESFEDGFTGEEHMKYVLSAQDKKRCRLNYLLAFLHICKCITVPGPYGSSGRQPCQGIG